MQTHYEVLDVSENSSEQDIKKSYRKLSLQYHPDRNGGDIAATEKYKKINEANEILSDQNKRQQYNMELKFGKGGGGNNMSADMGDINNIFSMMFGGNGGFPRGFPGGPHSPGMKVFHSTSGFPGQGFPGQGFPGQGFPGQEDFHGHPGMDHFFQQISKPPPIVKHIRITLEQAYTGAIIPIEIEKQVTQSVGRVVQIETINIQIPQGIEENEVMILRDYGHILNENVKGDVKITFEIKNSSIFKRHGMDLIYNKELTLKESLCGFSFEILHINGKVLNMNNLSNSAIIKPDFRKVVTGLGMVKNEKTGNLIIEMSIIFPDSLTKEQIENIRDIL
jgi:DnaJ-class molecular chaperone